MNEPHWVYYTIVYNFAHNAYQRYLLTAADIADAERKVLDSLAAGWTAHHSEMVCTTTDDPFFKEL